MDHLPFQYFCSWELDLEELILKSQNLYKKGNSKTDMPKKLQQYIEETSYIWIYNRHIIMRSSNSSTNKLPYLIPFRHMHEIQQRPASLIEVC